MSSTPGEDPIVAKAVITDPHFFRKNARAN